MAEIKRGFARDNFRALREAKDLGPYPSWDGWKSALTNFLGEQLPKNLEPHIHEWYVLRRQLQLNSLSAEESQQKSREFSNEHSSLFDNDLAVRAFKFVTEKTTAK